MVVYTAILSGKNNLLDPHHPDPKISYICYTDDINLRSDIWEIKYIPSHKDNIRLARMLKMKSHVLFPGEYTLWIDGTIELKFHDLSTFANSLFAKHDFFSFSNPARASVKEEVAYCIRENRDDPVLLQKQLDAYLRDGFPDQIKLYNSSFLLRDNKSPKVINFNRMWWEQICMYSRRDEVSLPYVMWKTQTEIRRLPYPSRYDCPEIVVHQHNLKN